MNEDDIARAKARARRRVLAARRALSAADRAAAAASVCRQLAAAPAFARARAVLGFYPLADEIDIRPFLAAVLTAGKILALPRVADSETRAMTIHRVTAAALQNPGRGLAAGFKGIFEPRPSDAVVDPQDIDFAVIPAVAVDRQKIRLGYGGGFYDTFIPRAKNAETAAAIYRCQRVARLPRTANDQKVNFIVSEE